MNTKTYRDSLNILVNQAAKEICASELLTPLIANMASIMASVSVAAKTSPEETIEVARHELDVMMSKYLLEYRRRERQR